MRHALPIRRAVRTGFTLVEMLVVMALIVLLAALAAGVANSGLIGSQRLSSGSNAISGWLLIAKQTAARDGKPQGVRFFGKPDATNNFLQFTEAQYIQQPESVVYTASGEGTPQNTCLVLNVEYDPANPTNVPPSPLNKRDLMFVSFSPPGPGGSPNAEVADLLQRVAAGDSLVLPEYGISTVLKSNPVAPNAGINGQPIVDGVPLQYGQYAFLDPTTYPDIAAGGQVRPTPPSNYPTTLKTYKFGFQNVPRPVLGEGPLTLSNDIGIDFRGIPTPIFPLPPTTAYRNGGTDNPLTTSGVDVVNDGGGVYHFDIVFAPSGRVLNNTAALTCLWVRDLSKLTDSLTGANPGVRDYYDAAGEQLLVVVYNRSGLLATQPVAPPTPNPAPAAETWDPYQYAKDGANNGI